MFWQEHQPKTQGVESPSPIRLQAPVELQSVPLPVQHLSTFAVSARYLGSPALIWLNERSPSLRLIFRVSCCTQLLEIYALLDLTQRNKIPLILRRLFRKRKNWFATCFIHHNAKRIDGHLCELHALRWFQSLLNNWRLLFRWSSLF